MQRTASYFQGFSFFEVLITLFILSVGLLTFANSQLVVAHNAQAIYWQTLALVQVDAMVERLRANPGCLPCEIARWQQINQQLLPQANSIVNGNNPYIITVNWVGFAGELHSLTRKLGI